MEFIEISSTANHNIKFLTTLVKNRKERHSSKKFVIEGEKLAMEAFSNFYEIEGAYFTKSAIEKHGMSLKPVIEASKNNYFISERVAEKISDLKTSQGVFLLVSMKEERPISNFHDSRRVMILNDIQDPGNVGAILRSASAFGFKTVISSDKTADFYSPKTMRSSMGSVFHLNVKNSEDIKKEISSLKKSGFTVFCAEKRPESISIKNIKDIDRLAIVVGNESKGIEDGVKCLCDFSVEIPIDDRVDSLNVAVASSILMWELSIEKTGGCFEI
ncbi:MAG: RNA methyltransferase [Ruminococcaceae bacterium]|nr:RNA methyltransferase [Oscillospiraceae bacterium]